MTSVPPWIAREGCLVLTVRLTPKSARDEIGGVDHLADGKAVLKVRVRAAPQDGEANAALIHLIAKALRVPASAVELATGATSRVKVLSLTGDPDAMRADLERLSGAGASAEGAAADRKISRRGGGKSPR